jgi:hypothetical protein
VIDFLSNVLSTTVGVAIAFYLDYKYSISVGKKAAQTARQQLLIILANGLEKNISHLLQLTTNELPEHLAPTYRLARGHFEGTIHQRADVFSAEPDLFARIESASFDCAHVNQKLDGISHMMILINSNDDHVIAATARMAFARECDATLAICERALGDLREIARTIRSLRTEYDRVSGDSYVHE